MEHPLLVSICAFLMLMIALSGVGYRLFYKPGRILRQLGSPVIADGRGVIENLSEPHPGAVVTILHRIGSRVQGTEAEMASMKADLIRAGFRSDNAVYVFYGIRILTTLVMLAVSLTLQNKVADNSGLRIALIGFGCMSGWILPRFLLERRLSQRQEILRLSLPDALDLMVVSVEAGLGLDQAMQHVARELRVSHPELSEDLELVTLEMRAGKRRAEALRNFAERTGEPEIRKLTAILIQNDRFGTSMAESLRNHSDFLRTRRRQEAEERAGKVGVKLVFPIFFFILPSMLIVAAGPGILQIFKYLFPMMRQVGH
jgi:tight adherence protein C